MRKPPSTSCDVWVFNWKFCGSGLKKASNAGPRHALIDVRVRNARAARPNTENTLLKPVLEPDMQGVVASRCCRAASASASNANGRGWHRKRSRGAQAGVLHPGAIGEVGRRQQADGLLPVAGQRLLRQIVGVDRRNAFERAAFLVERRIVIIDAGQDLSRASRRSSS